MPALQQSHPPRVRPGRRPAAPWVRQQARCPRRCPRRAEVKMRLLARPLQPAPAAAQWRSEGHLVPDCQSAIFWKSPVIVNSMSWLYCISTYAISLTGTNASCVLRWVLHHTGNSGMVVLMVRICRVCWQECPALVSLKFCSLPVCLRLKFAFLVGSLCTNRWWISLQRLAPSARCWRLFPAVGLGCLKLRLNFCHVVYPCRCACVSQPGPFWASDHSWTCSSGHVPMLQCFKV